LLIANESHRTLNEMIFQQLREAILDGELLPGEHLVQDDLAQKLGVSRIPVREAISRLQADGLVTVVPHKGAVVSSFTLEDLEQVYMLRSLLEGKAASIAAQRTHPDSLAALRRVLADTKRCLECADKGEAAEQATLCNCNRDFHLAIAHASGIKLLYTMIEKLWESFPRYGAATIPGQTVASYAEHWAIYEAMARGDGQEAANLLTCHIETAGKKFLDYYQQRLGPSRRPRLLYPSH
jgi:DNA-binding GntR family transcriptional regulator